MAPWPRGATCTQAPRGEGGMPLGLRLSEGLGVASGREVAQDMLSASFD